MQPHDTVKIDDVVEMTSESGPWLRYPVGAFVLLVSPCQGGSAVQLYARLVIILLSAQAVLWRKRCGWPAVSGCSPRSEIFRDCSSGSSGCASLPAFSTRSLGQAASFLTTGRCGC